MLKLSGKAKVEKFEGDIRTQGDGDVKGVVIRLLFSGVKVDHAKELVSQLHLLFDDKDEPALPEIGPLKVTRAVQNVEVEIGEVHFKGADLEKIKITPVSRKKVDISLEVTGAAAGVLDLLHGYLKQTMLVKLTERQLELQKLDGGVAPQPGEDKQASA